MTPETSSLINTVATTISAVCAVCAIGLVIYGWRITKKQSEDNSSRLECRAMISQIWNIIEAIEDESFKHYSSSVDDTNRTKSCYSIKSLIARLDRLVQSFSSYVQIDKLNSFDSYYSTVTNRLYEKEHVPTSHAIHVEIQQASTKLIEEIDKTFINKFSI